MPSPFSENTPELALHPLAKERITSMKSSVECPPDADYSAFFKDKEFATRYPDLVLPSPIFVSSGASILSFESGRNISLDFPVKRHQTNPLGTLQGGILCSFFDEAFGVLSFASLRKPCITIDMSIHFVRPALPGNHLTIRAEFKFRSRSLLQLYAEAHNGKNKLVATAISQLMPNEAGISGT